MNYGNDVEGTTGDVTPKNDVEGTTGDVTPKNESAHHKMAECAPLG